MQRRRRVAKSCVAGDSWPLSSHTRAHCLITEMTMANRNKQRGYELEREIMAIGQAAGLVCERAWCSDGRAMGEDRTVDCIVGGCRIQSKRSRTLPKYLDIPEACDTLAFKKDRGAVLCVLPFATLVQLIESAGGF